MKKLDLEKFEEFLSNYPVYEYRLLEAREISVEERVRLICKTSCQRYDQSWACPPGVGTLEECENRIHDYSYAIFFSSVAEVSDIMNMEEMLETRHAHEALTNDLNAFIREGGFDTFVLSTESCDICETCAYRIGKPCVHPERMHPCLESHGVVVSDIVEAKQMEYTLGGNTILWFSMILFR